MWLTRVSVNHPVFATMMMMAFVVLGLFSYQRLAVDQFPDIQLPVVVVSTEYPGASPEVVEVDVSRKIEEQVNTISGVNELSSRSYEGSSVVIIQFDLSVDPARAAQDVREKIALIRPSFRPEVKESLVTRVNPEDNPIISVALQSETRGARELTTLAEQVVKRRLENVRGVGRVTVVGGVRREVLVQLRPADMEAFRIGVDQVISALRTENQELPAGTLIASDREQVVQIRARMRSVEEFERIIVGRRGNQPIRLAQIADGRLRQIGNAPADAYPDPTQGVGISGDKVVADGSFSDKLNALKVDHDAAQVAAAQEAIFFERHAKNVLATRARIEDQSRRLDRKSTRLNSSHRT